MSGDTTPQHRQKRGESDTREAAEAAPSGPPARSRSLGTECGGVLRPQSNEAREKFEANNGVGNVCLLAYRK